MHLDKKIDEYSDELFLDLGLVSLPEEQKADIYARLQDHLHRVILQTLSKVLSAAEIERIKTTLEQEDYKSLSKIFKKYPQFLKELGSKVQEEFDRLKVIIREEQKHAREPSGASSE